MSFEIEAHGFIFGVGDDDCPLDSDITSEAGWHIEHELRALPPHRVATLWAHVFAQNEYHALMNSRHPSQLQIERIIERGLKYAAKSFNQPLYGGEDLYLYTLPERN